MPFFNFMKKLIVFILSIIIILTGCKRNDIYGNNVPISKDGFYFDTIITISIYGETKEKSERVIEDCFTIAQEMENKLSKTVTNSDIYNINNNLNSFVEVSEDTITVINTAIKYSTLSNGMFDITMGNVINLWDFEEGVLPDESDIKRELSEVNYKNISINNNTVCLSGTNVSLDVGGIAKGYIADKMKEYLLSQDIDCAIINLGGNVDVIGTKPDNSPFNVGIANPDDDSKALVSVECEDLSVVTSGTYQRYFEKDGISYHHILDTKTGFPVKNNIKSVTVISKSSIDCDALSTTCFLLGKEKGLKLIEEIDNTECIFILDDNSVVPSSGMGKSIGYTFL